MSELNIPESWALVPLGSICKKVGSGKTPKGGETSYASTGIPLIRSQNVLNGKLSLENVAYIYDSVHQKMKNTTVIQNDVLLNITGGSIGRSCVVPDDFSEGNVNQHVCIIRPAISNKAFSTYISNYLRSPFGQTLVKDNMKGAAREAINMEQINGFSIPLPPLSEVDRIIEKIDSCFEKIEATVVNLNKVKTLLEKYRESLLGKAFRGELTPQDPGDEPVSVLLEKERKERSQNTKEKKTDQEFTPITGDEKPFDLPDGWVWVKLGEISDQIQYGFTASASTSGTHKFLRITDITSDGVNWDGVPYCSPSKEDAIKLELLTGDILFARTGGTVGKSFLIRDSVKNSVFASYLIKVRPNQRVVLPDFLSVYFSSPSYWDFVTANQRGAAQPNINGTTLGNLPIPLPPIKEQSRIIKVCESSFEKISILNGILRGKMTTIAYLKESIFQKAFEGQLVEQILSEGTGHELLEKILAKKETTQKTESIEKNKKAATKTTSKKSVSTKGKNNGKK